MKLWDAATGQKALSFKGHTGGVTSVSFGPDGQRIASASSRDNTVKVLDAATGQETLSLKGHTRGVLSVSFSPDGQWMVSSCWDKPVMVWGGQPRETPIEAVPTKSDR